LFAELFILSISGLLIAFVISYLGITWGLVLAGVSMLSVGSLGYYFISIGYLIDVTWSLISMLLIGTQQFYLNFRTQFKLRQQIKKQFGTYLSPDMVAMLQKNPELLKLGGERKEMTFLFTDIMGFTPVSEVFKNNDDPEGLVELINTYLDKMTKIILANGGTIDKYMGDCIMAFWNAPLPCKNHAELAIKSAIEIEEATLELNKQFKEQGLDLPPINVGTGVNSGTCIVGNMGSETRFDYSVVGDAVNLSARLEATAGRNDYKQWKIIISEYTKDLAGDVFDYEKIDSILVKGKSEPITIYFPSLKYSIKNNF
jgi:adenylate cyclase